MRETIRLTPSPFKSSHQIVEYDIENWTCCREWEIVVASTTYNPVTENWKRDHWWVRKCGLCNSYPRPMEDG